MKSKDLKTKISHARSLIPSIVAVSECEVLLALIRWELVEELQTVDEFGDGGGLVVKSILIGAEAERTRLERLLQRRRELTGEVTVEEKNAAESRGVLSNPSGQDTDTAQMGTPPDILIALPPSDSAFQAPRTGSEQYAGSDAESAVNKPDANANAEGSSPPLEMATTAELVPMTQAERQDHWQKMEQREPPPPHCCPEVGQCALCTEHLPCPHCNRTFRGSVLAKHQPVCETKHARQVANQAADSVLVDNALGCSENLVEKPPRKRSMPSRLQARLQRGSGDAEEARKLKMEKMAARQALAEEKRREKCEARAAKAR